METFEEMHSIVDLKKGQVDSYKKALASLVIKNEVMDKHLNEYHKMKEILEGELKRRSG